MSCTYIYLVLKSGALKMSFSLKACILISHGAGRRVSVMFCLDRSLIVPQIECSDVSVRSKDLCATQRSRSNRKTEVDVVCW